jgi:hypothetical protein
MPAGYLLPQRTKITLSASLKTKIALEFESDTQIVFSDETLEKILTPSQAAEREPQRGSEQGLHFPL